VQFSAGYGQQTILHNLHLELLPGERLGLVGSSGAGKSTLLLALLGLLPWRGGWTRGEVFLGGRNLLALSERRAREVRGREIALVPQNPASALNSALTLRTHFEQGWKAHSSQGSMDLETRLQELLQRVHLPGDANFLRRKPSQISVGQAQRAAIALALLHRPSVLVADEPTSALDPITAAEVLKLLRDVTEDDGAALLFVSHDLLSVVQLCSRVAILRAGEIAECLPVEKLPEAQDAFTRALLGAFPLPLEQVLHQLQIKGQSSTEVPFTSR
jgi:ABC-type glutathione transport system ATPase component